MTAIHYFTPSDEIKDAYRAHFVAHRRWDILGVLQYAVMKFHSVRFNAGGGDVLSILIPGFALDLVTSYRDRGIPRADRFIALHDALSEATRNLHCICADVGIAITVVQEPAGEAVSGLNNCFFKTAQTIKHDELNFRSPAEIAVYDELKTRHLLFFPNAAAVLGGDKPENREPDFLICDKGKWGILEVMGDTYHKNAAKDHARARLFKTHGVTCIEFFSADECGSQPIAVVDRFLAILAKH
ncbi:MAG TPA: hypothetical protein VEL76_25610 [Gemmataceae bacterium]|nr:hypothetical protein [Gemmataceae bacterium]